MVHRDIAGRGSGGRLLIDPYIPLKGSAKRMNPDAFAGYDGVLVTHGYFDHLMGLPRILRESLTIA